MRKIIASVIAAGVLVAGAFVASTITSPEASAQTDEIPAATDETTRPLRGAILDGVLSDLVADGTLDQSQADAVTEALIAKHDEIKETFGDRHDRRTRRHDMHEKIREWLDDGVITSDELAQIDTDLPLFSDGPLAEALEDGEITQAEWDAFVEQRGEYRNPRRRFADTSVSS